MLRVEYIAAAAALFALVLGAAYIRELRGDLASTRAELELSKATADAYHDAARRAVADAAELMRSRDNADAARRDALDRIARAADQCLDQRLPLEIIDLD